jgi:hypothetical protein
MAAWRGPRARAPVARRQERYCFKFDRHRAPAFSERDLSRKPVPIPASSARTSNFVIMR